MIMAKATPSHLSGQNNNNSQFLGRSVSRSDVSNHISRHQSSSSTASSIPRSVSFKNNKDGSKEVTVEASIRVSCTFQSDQQGRVGGQHHSQPDLDGHEHGHNAGHVPAPGLHHHLVCCTCLQPVPGLQVGECGCLACSACLAQLGNIRYCSNCKAEVRFTELEKIIRFPEPGEMGKLFMTTAEKEEITIKKFYYNLVKEEREFKIVDRILTKQEAALNRKIAEEKEEFDIIVKQEEEMRRKIQEKTSLIADMEDSLRKQSTRNMVIQDRYSEQLQMPKVNQEALHKNEYFPRQQSRRQPDQMTTARSLSKNKIIQQIDISTNRNDNHYELQKSVGRKNSVQNMMSQSSTTELPIGLSNSGIRSILKKQFATPKRSRSQGRKNGLDQNRDVPATDSKKINDQKMIIKLSARSENLNKVHWIKMGKDSEAQEVDVSDDNKVYVNENDQNKKKFRKGSQSINYEGYKQKAAIATPARDVLRKQKVATPQSGMKENNTKNSAGLKSAEHWMENIVQSSVNSAKISVKEKVKTSSKENLVPSKKSAVPPLLLRSNKTKVTQAETNKRMEKMDLTYDYLDNMMNRVSGDGALKQAGAGMKERFMEQIKPSHNEAKEQTKEGGVTPKNSLFWDHYLL